jgi:hypothetical protein
MSLPGFTAETSLYNTKKHYKDAGSFPRLNKAIYPAQLGDITPWPVEVGDIGSLDTESPRTYGVVPPGKEDAFGACIEKCRAAGATFSACQRSCCRQFTGYYSCVMP